LFNLSKVLPKRLHAEDHLLIERLFFNTPDPILQEVFKESEVQHKKALKAALEVCTMIKMTDKQADVEENKVFKLSHA